MSTADIEVLEAALHHPLGRVPVEHDHTLGERTVVDPDTYRTSQFLGTIDKGTEALLDTGVHSGEDLLCPLLHSLRIDIVPWVDTYLLYILQCGIGRCGVEVDVRHQRRRDPFGTQCSVDGA